MSPQHVRHAIHDAGKGRKVEPLGAPVKYLSHSVSLVVDYKSFSDDGAEATFQSGIDVVVGQNNVGKTALLEAVALRFADASSEVFALIQRLMLSCEPSRALSWTSSSRSERSSSYSRSRAAMS